MKYFEALTLTIKEHKLRIVEVPCLLGFHLERKDEADKYHHVDSRDTLKECKELALEMYSAPMDGWQHSNGEYLESFIASSSGNKPGYTFRIVEDKTEGSYLYGFDKNQYQEYDYPQDTIQACKEFALEEFGIALDAWREKASSSLPLHKKLPQ